MKSVPCETNPFSTRFVEPGAGEFLFDTSEFGRLLASLEQLGFRGQIVGPHGSGKTTLLHALRQELSSREYMISWHELHDGERKLPFGPEESKSWNQRTIVMVDGYEQLSWWSRFQLKRRCCHENTGLIISTHVRQRGFPLLYETAPTLAGAQRIVSRLVADSPVRITADDVARLYESNRGNLREMLFALYDLFEERS